MPGLPTTSAAEAIRDPRERAIAVIGMSCRLPQARGLDAYWQLLCSGTNAVTETPPTRWDASSLHDSDFSAPGKV
ncbi:beta-ketoacyl synthase N-terminal-like domain-containing protein, partial [Streptomyces sp. MCAF7]